MKLSQKLTKEAVEPFFNGWDSLKVTIESSFRNRDGTGRQELLNGIKLYKQLLAHCDFEITPLNGPERLAFVEQRPTNFAAFRQLDELFSEMKKGIASKRIQLKRNEQ
ncbi:hypothetical protein QWY22_11765 [Planococcus liqunii]|uniref:YpoC-like domain-containing protein n=1 Tax=Planococcus liqunii TaxID=3058394 RepID=A0ABT8MLL6_9BACL|nr:MULTISPECIES: hypothetical protein [unclassified Planococcus (in: firmicutes)]MDN7225783.1 hypothetical protein [Planococcus sp. N064]WKA49577.1 hypothetical protein QWY22_11765 [Planococcus sp. N056]